MKKFNYKVSYDDDLGNIARGVSNDVRKVLRDEKHEEILKTPRVTTVDYRSGEKEISLDKSGLTPEGKDPYDIYSHVGDNGEITAARVTPEREEKVEEIFTDGTRKISSRDEFEKKIEENSVSNEELTELGRIVRVSSETPEAYSKAEERHKAAYEAFDQNKYKIEQAAARVGLPPSVLSAIYYKTVADEGSIVSGAPGIRNARLYYHRIFGQPLSWDDKTLSEYLETTEGVLDFIALGLKSEAEYYGYNTGTLTTNQLSDIITSYGNRNGSSPGYESAVTAYNKVFEDIYKKLPGEAYDIKLI